MTTDKSTKPADSPQGTSRRSRHGLTSAIQGDLFGSGFDTAVEVPNTNSAPAPRSAAAAAPVAVVPVFAEAGDVREAAEATSGHGDSLAQRRPIEHRHVDRQDHAVAEPATMRAEASHAPETAPETNEVVALAAALEAAHDQARGTQDCGTWLDNPRSAFSKWKLSQRVRGRVEFEDHSIEQYTSMWGRFCAWMVERPRGGALRVDEVTTVDIESYLMSLRGGRLGERPVAKSTARRYLFLLHRTFQHLEGLGVIDANPCAELPQLKGHQAAPRPARTLLLPSQESAYIEWCMDQPLRRWDQCRNRALRLIFLASGITVSEARRLRAADVCIQDVEDFGLARPQVGDRLAAAADLPAPAPEDGDQADVAGGQAGTGDIGGSEQSDGKSDARDAAAPAPIAADRRRRVALLEVEAHGNTPARTAPVASFAVEALEQWMKVRSASQAPGELLFNTKTMLGSGARLEAAGGPATEEESGRPSSASLSAEEIYDLVCTALRECNYEGHRAGPATLRNTFMARQIRAGIALDRIRDWVGLRTIEPLRTLQRQVPIRHDGLSPG